MSGIKVRMTTEIEFGGTTAFGTASNRVIAELEAEGDSTYSGRSSLSATHLEKAAGEQRKMATAVIESLSKAKGATK